MATSFDRSLKLAALALKAKLVDRQCLLEVMSEWVDHPERPLSEVLFERAGLSDGDKAMLALGLEDASQCQEGSLASQPDADAQAAFSELLEVAPAKVKTFVNSLLPTNSWSCPKRSDNSAEAPAGDATRFCILRHHASGGLGEVFLARDDDLDREVALKQIRDELADDPEVRARFMFEAKITGGLEHPGVVPVYGLGRDKDGSPYYAMRFIRGESLAEAVQRFHLQRLQSPDPTRESLALRRLLGAFVGLCNTVAYAHSRGVIHRDLKPENVMLGAYGETLLVDWGLAKVVGRHEQASAAPAALDATLRPPTASSLAETQLGSVVGTLAYMSPEQAAGLVDLLGPATDIYGLGATLYTLLTGTRPTASEPEMSLRDSVILGKLSPPRAVEPWVPAPLEAICLKAMARDPACRYTSATEIAEEIEAWLAGERVRSWREPWIQTARRWVSHHPRLASGSVAAVLVALVSLVILTVVLSAANERVRAAKLLAEQREQEARKNFLMARQAVDRHLARVSDDPRLRAYNLESLRRDLLSSAQRFYEQLIDLRPNDVDLRYERSWAHYRLGAICRQLGTPGQAIELLGKAQTSFEELLKSDPQSEKYQSSLARCRMDLGLLYREQGRTEEAASALEQARQAMELLAREHPSVLPYSLDLATLRENLGNLAVDARDDVTAEKEFRSAIALQSDLLRRHPDSEAAQAGLASAQSSLGLLYHLRQRGQQAVEALEAAREIQQRMAVKYPGVPTYQSDLAKTCNNLALVYGEIPERFNVAVDLQKKALEIRAQLSREHPSVIAYQRDLARSHHNLATLYSQHRQFADAEAAYNAAREIHQRLATAHPKVPEYKKDLATTCANLGAWLMLRDQPAESENAYRSALTILRSLVAENPRRAEYQVELASVLASLGHVLCSLGRPELGLAACQEAISILGGLATADRSSEKGNQFLLSAYWGCGEALDTLGRHAEAMANWDRARDMATGSARDLVRLDRAQCAVKMGRHAEATEEVKQLAGAAQGVGRALCRMAVICSLAATAAENDKSLAPAERQRLARSYAEQAIELLRQAKASGYFREAAGRKLLLEDPALEPLRKRSEFQQLLEG